MDASRRTLSVANSAVFVCHHCGCEGKSLEDMRRHMRRHRGLSVGDQVSRAEEVKRDTSMCRGQGEASRSKDVKRGHTGEKPFACDQCDYRAYKLSYMTKHIRIHTGEKPFSCDQCVYRGRWLSDLTKHKRIHIGEKPFVIGVITNRVYWMAYRGPRVCTAGKNHSLVIGAITVQVD
ncbi:hypothetical protein AAG570_007430 [Ranatra chinensis]|uniref:C2H2-type domain-containing protein n=1 Tax=Ranatra chinensis TaxID=642074 RepID=A0ABD0YJL5_9HEMI